jgi:hypothetical protein
LLIGKNIRLNNLGYNSNLTDYKWKSLFIAIYLTRFLKAFLFLSFLATKI